MCGNRKIILLFLALIAIEFPSISTARKSNKTSEAKKEIARQGNAVLWQNPRDIASRNLYFGPGGEKDAPHAALTFLKEDLEGSNPKFDARDDDGVKWKVKLGDEARPETVASRLVWAVGYFTNEDYFASEIRVQAMPAHLQRGSARKLDFSSGIVRNVRLKRSLENEKKIGTWRWRQNPYTGTRELNGLRVMMALINNWDLKDVNNAIYIEKDGEETEAPAQIYMVSDLGASFGAPGRWWPRKKSRGNLDVYSRARFISKATSEYVDFMTPTRPALVYSVGFPQFFGRLQMRWIGRRVPRGDAKWMGQLLAELSPEQIRDAFRAANYSPEEVERFAKVIERRIGELNEL